MNVHMVKRHLERIDDSFRMFAMGRISTFILAVNLRQHGATIGVAIPAAQEALDQLAAEVDAEGAKAGDGKLAIAGMHDRFKAWRKHVEETIRDTPPVPVRTGPDPALAAAAAEVDAMLGRDDASAEPEAPATAPPALPDDEDLDEEAPMSIEEIERILDDTRRKL